MEFFRVDPSVFPPQERRLTAEFDREKIYLWVDALYIFTFSSVLTSTVFRIYSRGFSMTVLSCFY
jgi:hypothetical protein